MDKSVLVIGSGGREHCIAWKLATSPLIKNVFVSPGNGGTYSSGKISNSDLQVSDFDGVCVWCKSNNIALVVVGPEDPLAKGIVDHLTKEGIPCFGPSAKAAQIEASKEFSKAFMDKHGIPTARWRSFTDPDQAKDYINQADHDALVVKASGLAAGKGVVVCKDKQEACQIAQEMLVDNKLGSAGHIVVVEELLQGEEVSCLAFSDGENVVCFPPAQDHKRLLDGNEGPNTGGMGAYCPCPLVSKQDLSFIEKNVIQKTIDGMKEDGMPYVGILYAGLMLTPDGPKVLEFNCRLGDPETQVLLPLLQSDMYPVLKACVNGTLNQEKVIFEDDTNAVCVVLVSEGYPGKYPKGRTITGLENVREELKLDIFHAGTKLDGEKLLTNGGRVLAVVAKDEDLGTAAWKALLGANNIKFDGKFFRKDIAHHALKTEETSTSITYSDSGVDVAAGDAFVDEIKPSVKGTVRPGCTAELGGFGGVFDVKAAGYVDPLLVSGTDGVGTKLKVAHHSGNHGTIGEDLVAMCVNDILCHGAEPLYFLDYFACGKLDVNVAKEVVEGVTSGCKKAGCALLGGETAEMPGMYTGGDYDLAGFAVGAVERDQYLPKLPEIQPGDKIVGISSSGLHSNGFSLVRRVLEHCEFTYDMLCPWSNELLGSALLTPTKIYVKSVLPLLKSGVVKAVAHITGGGLPGNVCRILPDGMAAQLDASQWEVHPVFSWIAEKGNVCGKEMARTFNLGVGMTLIVASKDTEKVLQELSDSGETATIIGSICKHNKGDRVSIANLDKSLDHIHHKHHHAPSSNKSFNDKRPRVSEKNITKRKVGVLISGTGTNLQALLDHTRDTTTESCAEIVLVISNKPDVQGLKRAQAVGIQTKVIEHKAYPSREAFDAVVSKCLLDAGVEIVCLAGFMRILSGEFVTEWRGKLLNVHPALLPSFKGKDAPKQALEAGVCVAGCSVHFVVEEVDAGAIVVQETVPVFLTDTEDVLSERIKQKEHIAFPKALELLASRKVELEDSGKVKWTL